MMPEKYIADYLRLIAFGKPSCIFVRKDKVSKISKEQLQKIRELGYEVPNLTY